MSFLLFSRNEVNQIMKTSFIKGIQTASLIYNERICLYASLITYIFLGHQLHGDVVFSMAQLFNIVQLYGGGLFRMALVLGTESKISIMRIQKFLLLEERIVVNQITNNDKVSDEKQKNKGTVDVIKVNAGWLPNASTLSDLNVCIKPGTLCCIAGSVGSGKSSFLQLLLQELPSSTGEVNITGSLSYAVQDPWLFVASVRDNILFGKPYEKSR